MVREAVYIADANVLIDFLDLGLGALWTDHFVCVTTPEVMAEVSVEDARDAGWLTDPSRIRVDDGPQTDRASATRLHQRHKALSYPDATVVVLAQRTGGVVLSGDGPMRRLASQFGIQVHGMIFVLDKLFTLKAISAEDACTFIDRWQEVNPRTPKQLCERYRRKWMSGD